MKNPSMLQWLRFQVLDETYNHLNVRQAAKMRTIAERRHEPYRLTFHRMGHGSRTIHDSLREKVS